MSTVREATYDVLRSLGMTTIFGNPGSNELPFLDRLPSDFTPAVASSTRSRVGCDKMNTHSEIRVSLNMSVRCVATDAAPNN